MLTPHLHETVSSALLEEIDRSAAGYAPDTTSGLAGLAQEHEQFATWPQAFYAGEHIRTSTKNARDWRYWRLNIGFPPIHFDPDVPFPDPTAPTCALLEHLVWSRIDIADLPVVGSSETPLHPVGRKNIYTAFDGLKRELFGDEASMLARSLFPGMTWHHIVEGLVSSEVTLGLPTEPGHQPRVNPEVAFLDPNVPRNVTIQLA